MLGSNIVFKGEIFFVFCVEMQTCLFPWKRAIFIRVCCFNVNPVVMDQSEAFFPCAFIQKKELNEEEERKKSSIKEHYVEDLSKYLIKKRKNCSGEKRRGRWNFVIMSKDFFDFKP